VCTRIGGLGFGDNCSIGDVSIGNVAGRDINYYVMGDDNGKSGSGARSVIGQLPHLSILHKILLRRSQLLELQIAHFGEYCPAYILIEYENVLEKLQKLSAEGGSL